MRLVFLFKFEKHPAFFLRIVVCLDAMDVYATWVCRREHCNEKFTTKRELYFHEEIHILGKYYCKVFSIFLLKKKKKIN